MSGIFYRNIALMLVSIAVIPIMASLNAPKPINQNWIDKTKAQFSKNGGGHGDRGGHSSRGCSAGRGRGDGGNRTNTRRKWKGDDAKVSAALTVASENTMKNGAWFANLAGGIPPILLDITSNGLLILCPFPFLSLISSGLNQGRILLREAVVGQRPPQQLLQQLWLVSLLVAH
jgi:hypothetical protein